MEINHEPRFDPLQVRLQNGLTYLVREYSPIDFKALVEMYKGFSPKRRAQGLPPPDLRRIAHWLDHLQQQSRALLGVDGERVVGHVILCPISDAAMEFAVFVHQDYRRSGLGTALAGLAINLASRAGFAELYLTTEISNHAALALYQKVGFQITSSYGNECEMSLQLAPCHAVRARAA